jgi:integrase
MINVKRQATAAAAAAPWSYIAGEKGRNRVRVFELGPVIYIDYREDDGRRVKRSLQHGERDRAKQHADEIAAKFGRDDQRPTGATTLQGLLKIYEQEVTPTKAVETQRHDRRTFKLFLKAFGANHRVETLNVRDWQSYIARRRSGAIAPPRTLGMPVRGRMLEQDCKLLLAVLNWAERARDDRGAFILEKNPLRGLAIPREESPQRPMMTAELFDVVRTKAAAHSSSAELFVCLLWFTGHRAASVRQLRWDDVDVAAKTVRWRAEIDKIGYAHKNPLHPELVVLLERDKAIAELTGEQLIFPSPAKAGAPMTRDEAARLWRAIADASGIKVGSRIGTHSFRRAFANRLRDVPMRELKDLGGWKTEKTVIGTYLQPDEDAQRAALEKLTPSRS